MRFVSTMRFVGAARAVRNSIQGLRDASLRAVVPALLAVSGAASPARAQAEAVQVGTISLLGAATDMGPGQLQANRFTVGSQRFLVGEIRTVAYLWPGDRQPPTRRIQARIYSSGGSGTPGADLTGAMLSQRMPLFSSDYAVFRPGSDLYLEANTSYWLAVGSLPAGSSDATNIDWMGFYNGGGLPNDGQSGSNGTVDPFYSRSLDGGTTWSAPSQLGLLHVITISNSLAPEPAAAACMLTGAVPALAFLRSRRRRG